MCDQYGKETVLIRNFVLIHDAEVRKVGINFSKQTFIFKFIEFWRM